MAASILLFSNYTLKTQSRTIFSSPKLICHRLNCKRNHTVTEATSVGDSLSICKVINGLWQTSGGWGEINKENAVNAMLQYADAGFTTFDMADIYGPAEDIYGMFINKVRQEHPSELLEQIKGLTKWVPDPAVEMTGSYVRERIGNSLKRMNVDSLDMVQFHWWDYSKPGYLDALKHLTDLKEEGKIRNLGLTNFDTERLQTILDNGIPIVSNQVQHSIVDMRPQQRMVQLCHKKGVKFITYGTLLGGLLSEKYIDTNLSLGIRPSDTPSLRKYKPMIDAWGGWNLFQDLLKTLKKIATKHGVSIPVVAPSVASSIVGVRLGLSEHIKDNKAVFSFVLDKDDINNIQEVTAEGKDLLSALGDCANEIRVK